MPKPLTERQLIDRLLKEPKGRIVLSNLIDGRAEKLFSKDTLKEFFTWWRHSIPCFEAIPSPSSSTGDDSVFDALAALTLSPHAWTGLHTTYSDLASLGTKPDFRMICRRPLRGKGAAFNLLITLDTETFLPHLAADVKEELIGKSYMDVTPDGSRVFATRKDGRRYSASLTRLKAGAQLGRPGGILWFTRAGDVRGHLVSGNADPLRDALGLIHFEGNVDLIAIEFQTSAVSNDARPTPLEPGVNRRFKTTADGTKARKRTAWGHTADLNRFAANHGNIDGAPERVSTPLPTSDITLHQIHVIGRTRLCRGVTKADGDESFARRVARGRSRSVLRSAILSLL